MSPIQDRIDDALCLWRAGRREGAFLLALLAVIIRARQDFPPPTREGESFQRFVQSQFPTRISVEYRSKLWPLEQVFYKWVRCEIVHQGGLPMDLCFTEDADMSELKVRAGGAPDYVLLVSPGWFYQVIAWAEA